MEIGDAGTGFLVWEEAWSKIGPFSWECYARKRRNWQHDGDIFVAIGIFVVISSCGRKNWWYQTRTDASCLHNITINRETLSVPMRNRTSDLSIPRTDALSPRLNEEPGYCEVHITRLLHIVRISIVESVMFKCLWLGISFGIFWLIAVFRIRSNRLIVHWKYDSNLDAKRSFVFVLNHRFCLNSASDWSVIFTLSRCLKIASAFSPMSLVSLSK